MRIVWSPTAVRRVIEEARHIAADRPMAAEAWADAIFDAVEPLRDFPRAGRVVPELGDDAIRELIEAPYRIVYQVEAERVVVLTVHHGSRLLSSGDVPSGSP